MAATCSRVLIISNGRIAADGKPEMNAQRSAQGHMDLSVEILGDERGGAQRAGVGARVKTVTPTEADDATVDSGHRFWSWRRRRRPARRDLPWRRRKAGPDRSCGASGRR